MTTVITMCSAPAPAVAGTASAVSASAATISRRSMRVSIWCSFISSPFPSIVRDRRIGFELPLPRRLRGAARDRNAGYEDVQVGASRGGYRHVSAIVRTSTATPGLCGHARGELERLVAARAVHDVEAADAFLRLGERAVRDEWLARPVARPRPLR